MPVSNIKVYLTAQELTCLVACCVDCIEPSTVLRITYRLYTCTMIVVFLKYRIVESFERVTSQYAQQIPPNAKENFTNPSVSIMAENVSSDAYDQQ